MRWPPSILPEPLNANTSNPDTHLFRQATLPLTFAVRADRGSRLILTCWQPATARDHSASTKLHVGPDDFPVAVSSTSKR
jgi:hypothetical protein